MNAELKSLIYYLLAAMALVLLSCTSQKTIKAINKQVSVYDTYHLDTSILLCADTSMTEFCVHVDYYLSADSEMSKIVARHDSVVAYQNTTFYFSKSSLIKTQSSDDKNKPVVYYYEEGTPVTKKMRNDDGNRALKNAAESYQRIFFEMHRR